VELVARVADATGVDVGVADFAEHSTVAALAALVDGASKSPAAGAPAAAGSLLFFLHSDYGRAGADCVMLGRQFGPDPRLVAVPPHGADGGSVPGTIEAMAARHVDRLRALQPRGPYHVAGHCSAGVVAFEVARQLCAAGEAVETLVLVEPPPLRAVQHPDGRLQRLGPSPLRRAWRRARGLAARLGRAVRDGRLPAAVARTVRTRWTGPHDGASMTATERRVETAYAGAVARYAAVRWPGTVTCIRTHASVAAGEFAADSWRQAAGALRIDLVPGDHESCLGAEAAALADRLRACLRARGAAPA
jgi:thioesterase domain-containing protein